MPSLVWKLHESNRTCKYMQTVVCYSEAERQKKTKEKSKKKTRKEVKHLGQDPQEEGKLEVTEGEATNQKDNYLELRAEKGGQA